jgi:molecular chaperone DnaK (HSP70)
MREAAITAGLVASSRAGDTTWRDRLRIITEPEAAAVHCAQLNDLHHLKASQNFMVCDAGGGTVDLAVYKVGSFVQPLFSSSDSFVDHWPDGESRNRGDVCTVRC